MSKIRAVIGFAQTEESLPGVHSETITEKTYTGDLYKVGFRSDSNVSVNPNLQLSNKFNMLADSFAKNNFKNIRYIHFSGSKWTINDISLEGKRIILSIGSLHNA